MQVSQVVELKETDGSLKDLIITAIFQGSWEGLVGIHNPKIEIDKDGRSDYNILAEGSVSGKLQFGQSFTEFSGTFEVVGYSSARVDLGFDELEINIKEV